MFGIIGNVGPWELALILGIVLIIFGAGKLPDVGRSLGKSITEFRNASKEPEDTGKKAVETSKDQPSA